MHNPGKINKQVFLLAFGLPYGHYKSWGLQHPGQALM